MEKTNTTERDPRIEELTDAINETSDPQKTLKILVALLSAAYGD